MDEMESIRPMVGEYKGKPILTLNPGDRYPFSFGVPKAKMIMKNLDVIKAFIEKYDNKTDATKEP